MQASADSRVTKILILASLSGGYRGADSVGQLHASYPANTYILPMVDALVVGGGIAGMQSALDLADQGYRVALVEREPSIGGQDDHAEQGLPHTGLLQLYHDAQDVRCCAS
jgi:heterodisulfide reductase subunit A-like polyferredoxin